MGLTEVSKEDDLSAESPTIDGDDMLLLTATGRGGNKSDFEKKCPYQRQTIPSTIKRRTNDEEKKTRSSSWTHHQGTVSALRVTICSHLESKRRTCTSSIDVSALNLFDQLGNCDPRRVSSNAMESSSGINSGMIDRLINAYCISLLTVYGGRATR